MANITETKFSDIYISASDRKSYIPDKRTFNALMLFEPEDFDEFFSLVESTWDGENSSYSVCYNGIFYRVERSEAISGVQYCIRKMPSTIPSIRVLGYPTELVNFLLTLRRSSGLILCSGPTGSGKTTTVSSLLKEFLLKEGGFAYTIEDPTEQPLDASEVLRAATSGHLVFSTIHANNVTDAINSIVKYASAGEMSEDLAYDLFSRGMLGIIHQNLVGKGIKKPQVSFLFANPDTSKGDQVRGIIKTGKLNLATSIETQMTRMAKGLSLFPENN